MATKICEYCGKEFKAKDKRTKFCSTECKIIGFKLNLKQKTLEPAVDLTPYLTRGTIKAFR